LEATIIGDFLLDLGGLVGRDALGELFAAKEALEHIIGTAAGGATAAGLKELLAQATAAEAVDGLHFSDERRLFLKQ
jgi:hypothetical protein